MNHNWKEVKLSELLKLNLDSVDVSSELEFHFAGVYCFGKGLFEKGYISGSETSYKTYNRLHKDHIVVSKVKGWEGAIALVNDEFEGMFLSPVYPTFNLISHDKAEIKFIDLYLSQKIVWEKLFENSKGIGARRNSISESQFLNLSIFLPPLQEQQLIVSKIEDVKSKLDEIILLRKIQTKEINNLLFSKYTELIETAEWLSMKEVAPIIRREVKLKDAALYPELGIRCFGKGTFHKPALTGLEVGTKKVFQIKKGDLVFSNVFAWEGGIAVAQEEDDGRYGSHRFISCVVDSDRVLEEFLCFHFLSPKGLEDINACSPGGAGRNKTLGLDKLMRINVPIPSLEMQREFVDLLGKANVIKGYYNQTERELSDLMPSLLDKAFKGKL
jgi:type I restriction enzyme S subunit